MMDEVTEILPTDWKPEKRSGIWKEAPEPENGRNSFNPEAPRR